MITKELASKFAHEWLDAWNAHDVNLITKHYDAAIEFCSPFVQKILGIPDGIIRGVDNFRDYITNQLKKNSTLQFELLDIFASPHSIVLYYKINNDLLATEVILLNPEMKAIKIYANYQVIGKGWSAFEP